jgi:hypothetical protein
MSKQPPDRPRTSIVITALIFAVIVIVLLGAASAILGLGSAPLIGKWGKFDIKTTSVGLVLVFEGLIFLYKLVKLLPPGRWGPAVTPQAPSALLTGDTQLENTGGRD